MTIFPELWHLIKKYKRWVNFSADAEIFFLILNIFLPENWEMIYKKYPILFFRTNKMLPYQGLLWLIYVFDASALKLFTCTLWWSSRLAYMIQFLADDVGNKVRHFMQLSPKWSLFQTLSSRKKKKFQVICWFCQQSIKGLTPHWNIKK